MDRVRPPREHVHGQVRPEEVELAALDLSIGGLAQRAELRRQQLRGLLEHVRVRRDVDDGAEARVRDGAVVALEVVLAADLPVGHVGRLRAVVEGERVHVDARGRDQSGQVAERFLERRCVRRRVDEHQRPPGAHRDGNEPEPVRLEARLARRPRRRPQRPVEAVGPGVVRALDRLSPPVLVHEHRAAVPADVEEAAQLAVAGAREQHRRVAGPDGRVRARLRDPLGVTDVLPRAREDPLLLAAQDLGRRVPRIRERRLHERHRTRPEKPVESGNSRLHSGRSLRRGISR